MSNVEMIEKTSDDVGSSSTGFSHGQLKSIVERVERLEEEKANISEDIKEVYSEAKSNGFDAKIIRKIISLRKKDEAQRQEEESLMDIYMTALGMVPGEEEGEME